MVKTKYDKQAESFLKATNTAIAIKFDSYKVYFPKDKEKRDVYNVTLKRGNREYTFTFGNSLNNSGCQIIGFKGRIVKTIITEDYFKYLKQAKKYKKSLRQMFNLHNLNSYKISSSREIKPPKEPKPYDVLACLDVLYDDSFEDFCSSFGYDTDSIAAEKIYKACLEQSNQLKILFNDKELEKLAEIA